MENIREIRELRERTGVFRNRRAAGEVLAGLLGELQGEGPLVLAVPAGGVPVAAVCAEALAAPLDVAVVSKITLPWNTEAGYGAVAFDGTTKLNEGWLATLGFSAGQIEKGIARTREKVRRRTLLFRGEKPFPAVAGRPVILVDDGLASGFTLLTAVAALRAQGADRLLVAVPTGHRRAVEKVAREVETVYCANVRGGWSFAVADAYEQWSDVSEEEALEILAKADKAT